MRRKSERNKTGNTSVVSPEKTGRKLTRRGRRSESQTQPTSNDDAEKEHSTEEQTEPHTSDRDSSSDREAKELAAKPRRKISRTTRRNSSEPKEIKPTRSRRRTAASTVIEEIETVVEEDHENENGDSNEEKPTESNADETTNISETTDKNEPKSKSPERVEVVADEKEHPAIEKSFEEPASEETRELADASCELDDSNKSIEEAHKEGEETQNCNTNEKDVDASPQEANESQEKVNSPVIEPIKETSSEQNVDKTLNETLEKERSPVRTENKTTPQKASPTHKSPENTKRSSHQSSRKSRERRRRDHSSSSSSSSSSSASSRSSSRDAEDKSRKQGSPEKERYTKKRPEIAEEEPSKSPDTPPKRAKRQISPISLVANNATINQDVESPMEVDVETHDDRFGTNNMKNSSLSNEKSPAATSVSSSSLQKEITVTSSVNDKIEKNIPQKDVGQSEKKSSESSSSNVEKKQEKPKRKRKWLSQKSTEPKPQIIAISTDSLKNLISDVKPVSLADVKLESSPEPEVIAVNSDDIGGGKTKATNKNDNNKERNRRRDRSVENVKKTIINDKQISSVPLDEKTNNNNLTVNRKISLVNDSMPIKVRPPSPPKNSASNILYITNLVRPFTVLQLKGLLARTGKIVENGFWIDKIKSKCFVKYETEDEAVETRHALHGVRWPASNPKCLNVDFGTVVAMGKAIASTSEDVQKEVVREERVSGGWDRFEAEERREPATNRPIREWDVGKKDELIRDRERANDGRDKEQRGGERERDRGNERGNINRGKDSERIERRRRSLDRIRRSLSASPARKFNKKENDPPIRLLDDLFRKTKATPCIYWLPLTAEQIAIKEENRRKQMAEHKRRIEENQQKEKERERERDRERDRDRDRERNRDRTDRRSKAKDVIASGGGGGSGGRDNRDRDRDRRRY